MAQLVKPFTRREGLVRAASTLALLPFAAHPRLIASQSTSDRDDADATGDAASDSLNANVDLCQQIIVPAYFDPGPAWDRAIDGPAGIMILNPNSGAGNYQDRWKTVTQNAQRNGVEILGYVRTNLAKRPPKEVKKEIDNYFRWYGVNGIFFDVATGTAKTIRYYRDLADYVHKRPSRPLVALNPALALNERYLSFVDILSIYEWKHSQYKKKKLPAWIHKYGPERFIHIIYDVPNQSAALATLNLSKQRNAGYVFITNVSNPTRVYKSLGNHWNLLVNNVC